MKILLISLLFSSFAAAQSVKLDSIEVDGNVYNLVTVILASPTEVKIMHEGGIKRVAATRLPSDVLAKIGYDANLANKVQVEQMAHLKAKKENDFEKAALKTGEVWVQGKIFQVASDGVIIHDAYYKTTQRIDSPVKYKVLVSGPSALYPNAPKRYETRFKSNWIDKESRYLLGDIFLYCSTEGLVDDGRIRAASYPIGTYSYTTVLGATKTLKAYTMDKERFLAEVKK